MTTMQEAATRDVLDALRREYPYLAMAYDAIKERFRRDLGPEDDYNFACTGLSEMYVGSLIQHLSFTEEFAITHFAPKDHPYHQKAWNPFDGGADFDDFILHLAPRDEDMAAAWISKLSDMGLPSARCDAMIERASNVYTSDEHGIRYFAESCIPQVPTSYLMKELAGLREVLSTPATSVTP